jgi:hypothetical protein
MPRNFIANNAFSTLSVAVTSNTQSTLTLQSGHGARFPSPVPPGFFYVTIDDGTNIEVCICIERSGDVLTVLRGQDGTTAQSSFAVGTPVQLRLPRASLQDMAFDSRMNQVGMIPLIGVASWSSLGLRVPTQVGCVTGNTLNNSSWANSQPRISLRSATSAQNPINWRVPDPVCNVGFGFKYRQRFGVWIAPNSSHFFIGLVNTTGAVNSVHPPSSLTNAIVAGWAEQGGVPNLSIWRNDNAGNAVQWDLGSHFNCGSTAFFELDLECQGNTPAVECTVRRLDISSIAAVSTVFTTDIPPNSAWLSPYVAGSTMVTSSIWVNLGPVTVTI